MQRKITTLSILILTALSLIPAHAALGTAPQSAYIEVIHHDDSGTEIEFFIGDLEILIGDQGETLYRFPGETPGTIPQLTRLIAIPAYKQVNVEITEAEYELFDYPVDFEIPENPVTAGQPSIMRDLRIVPVTIYPVQLDENTGDARILKSAVIRMTYSGYSDVNNKVFTGASSESFASLYGSTVLNYDWLDENGSSAGRGSYFVISPKYYYDFAQLEFDSFLNWKRQKGYNMETHLIPYSTTNPPKTEILALIENAYENFDPPLEYVLLVGDVDGGTYRIPTYTIVKPGGGENDPTDHNYTCLEGDDYFSDIFLGRASVSNGTQAKVMLNKFRRYEAEPMMTDTTWYKKAMCVGGNYSDGFIPITPCQTIWWIADHLRMAGYTQVDTICYWGNWDPTYPATGEILAALNDGRALSFYRGWSDQEGWEYPQFRIDDFSPPGALSNGWKLNVMGSFVCNTGNFNYPDLPACFGEAILRHGTIANGGGVVAFIGPSDLNTNTNYNNSISAGFVQALIEDDLHIVGQTLAAAKMHLYEGFPHTQPAGLMNWFYFHVYNLLGEPSLDIWTDTPQYMTVSHVSSLPAGGSYIDVSVNQSGAPLSETYVTIVQNSELLGGGYTDSNGDITINFTPLTAGTAILTVTKHNCYPYTANITVSTQEFVGYYSDSLTVESIDDDALNPGENAAIRVTLKNYGSAAANNVNVTLSSDNPSITVSNPSFNYGNFASGATIHHDYNVSADEDAYAVDEVSFTIQTSTGDISKFDVPFNGFNLDFVEYSIAGGSLQVNVESDLIVTLINNSDFTIQNLQVTLGSYDEDIQIIDGTADFGDLNPGASADNSSNPFIIKPLEGIWNGRMIQMTLTPFDNQSPVYFDIMAGVPEVSDPTGPDPYGYFAYDDGDIGYYKTPVFDWVELDPNYSGDPGYIPGADLINLADDSSIVIELPFTFKFYGEDFDTITVCSNGWISFGSTWMANFRNWDIPSPLGPPNMIMPFWDDLKDTSDLLVDIYYLYDSAEDRFIIEWSRTDNRYITAAEIEETFELILFDPAAQSGPTGDGDILFQYLVVNDVDNDNNYSTVGITDYMHQRALQYVFSKQYAVTSDTLRDEMAICISTTPPDFFTGVEEHEILSPLEFRLKGNHPNPFNPMTVISYELRVTSQVKLAVYDVLGREAAVLVDGSLSAGPHEAVFNASGLSSGIYFAKLQAGDYTGIQKMLLLK
ncbi:T9SS type A sorting domain-containing protein [bacterium]|nr:T9SS type A sorting domain-containing protein [bacterium]